MLLRPPAAADLLICSWIKWHTFGADLLLDRLAHLWCFCKLPPLLQPPCFVMLRVRLHAQGSCKQAL